MLTAAFCHFLHKMERRKGRPARADPNPLAQRDCPLAFYPLMNTCVRHAKLARQLGDSTGFFDDRLDFHDGMLAGLQKKCKKGLTGLLAVLMLHSTPHEPASRRRG